MHVLVSTAGEKPKNVAGVITAPGPTAPVHHHAEGGPTLSQPASVDLLSLPWTATEDDIKTFVGVSVVKVLIVLNDYRKPSGNARVWLEDKEDVGKVLEELALWIVHWKLRDHAKASLINDLKHPVKTFLYLWSDWKEP